MNPVYATATAASLTAFKTLRWDVRVSGSQHIPATGGGVIATNHVGYLDFVFCGYGAREQGGRRVRFVAKREVFDNRFAGPLMRAMRHIPVDRGGNTAVAMRDVAAALADGDLVGMFPEGTINRSFVPQEGRPGAARMAVDAGVPLIPGAIWGSQRIFSKGRKLQAARGTAVMVAFGPPVSYQPDEDPKAVHERLMASIRSQTDELQRSYPQRPADQADAWWLPAHLGGGAPSPEQAAAWAREEAAERRRRRAEGG